MQYVAGTTHTSLSACGRSQTDLLPTGRADSCCVAPSGGVRESLCACAGAPWKNFAKITSRRRTWIAPIDFPINDSTATVRDASSAAAAFRERSCFRPRMSQACSFTENPSSSRIQPIHSAQSLVGRSWREHHRTDAVVPIVQMLVSRLEVPRGLLWANL